MNQSSTESFNTFAAHFLGRRLPEQMVAGICFPELPSDVQRFIRRMFALMRKAEFPVTDITPVLIWQLSNIIPGFLPCAWNDRVPPLTLPKRHQKMDSYVYEHAWPEKLESPVFVDMGCGFPPITTSDTADALTGWHIFGIDRSFFDYVVYDNNGHYACFNRQGTFQYFQPKMNVASPRMYQDLKGVRLEFENFFDELYPLLTKTTSKSSETVEKNGRTLIHHPIREYEKPGLTFIESEMEEAQVPPAHVIRCMNTLLYFDPETRKSMLEQAGTLLADSGIMIAGSNLMNGSGCRYIVYKKNNQSIQPTEFAVSLDNLRPLNVMPWYTLHDDDPEAILLADLTRHLRTDKPFWGIFTERLDELMQQHGLFQRDGNGFLYASVNEDFAGDFAERTAQLWLQVAEEGFTDGAVDALNRAGYTAWKNQVGDIAIKPGFCSLKPPCKAETMSHDISPA